MSTDQNDVVARAVAFREASPPVQRSGPSDLADILERVLDKGIVIAGDIQINLLDIELLTIKLRLLVASVDRAREMGINWWEGDASLSSGAKQLEAENEELRKRIERLEKAAQLPKSGSASKKKSGS
jgi:Gas vesicle protein